MLRHYYITYHVLKIVSVCTKIVRTKRTNFSEIVSGHVLELVLYLYHQQGTEQPRRTGVPKGKARTPDNTGKQDKGIVRRTEVLRYFKACRGMAERKERTHHDRKND